MFVYAFSLHTFTSSYNLLRRTNMICRFISIVAIYIYGEGHTTFNMTKNYDEL